MREKSAWESPNGIIYWATLHLSQSARVACASICTCATFGYSRFAHASICTHVMFGYSRVPIWDIECRKTWAINIPNGNSGVSESCACANRSTCNTCTLGQVRSGPVYYTIQRLMSTLFLFPCSSHLYASFLILTLHHLTFRQCVVDCI